MPASPYVRRSITWQDASGRQRLTSLTGITGTGAPATMSAIKACSNADWLTWWEGPVTPTTDVPPDAPGPYQTVGYVLAMSVETASGDSNRIFLPAPIQADASPRTTLLQGDGQTLDLALASTGALQTTLAGELRNPLTGEAVTTIVAGWVSRWTAALAERLDVTAGSPLTRRSIRYTDNAGRDFLAILTSLTGAPNSMAALANHSTAVVTEWWEGPTTLNGAPAFLTAHYQSVSDEARLYFIDATGSKTSILIPAPKRTIFLPDGKTVDASNTDVASLITAALAELLVPSTALPLLAYYGGYFHHNRRTSL